MGLFGFLVLIVVVLALAKIYVTITADPNQATRQASESGADNGRSFHSKVVGVTFSNADGTSRQTIIKSCCKAGQALRLESEPNNPRDPQAVGVWIPAGQIGYIQSGRLAEDLARYIRTGTKTVTAEISNVTGGTNKKASYGVNILIHIE